MARRGSPALYELLGRSRDSKGSGGTGSTGTPIPKVQTVVPINVPPRKQGGGMQIGSKAAIARSAAAGESMGPKGSAGAKAVLDLRALRIGGLAVLALGLLVGVYMLGISRGSSNAEGGASPTAGSEQATAGQTADANRAAVQPSTPSEGSVAARSASPKSSATPNAVPAAPQASENSPRTSVANADPDLGPPLPPATKGIDPRQAGLQYCVIASVLEANADKLVQFCRDRGLDAWVVPDHNGRLREITVLPGLPKSELKGAAATALDARIRKVGALWKAAGRGNSDFEDRYFKPFNG